MTYDEAMAALNDAMYAVVRAANNEGGAPVEALRKMASDIDCLIDHRCTRAEFEEKQAAQAVQAPRRHQWQK